MGEDLFVWAVFVAGIGSFFSPCILPVLPVYVSNLSLDLSGNKGKNIDLHFMKLHPILILKTLIFVGGISISFVTLGFGAGFLGSFITGKWFIKICGIIVILLGIHQMGVFHIKALDRERKVNVEVKDNLIGTFLLGATFSFGWTPCIGPVLGAILGISASGGQPLYSAILMAIYSLGLMIPFVVISIFSDLLLGKIRYLNKHTNKIKIVGGIIIIIMGIVLLTGKLNVISGWLYF